jgi:WhiB family redox-sensing transcriptional regulator
MSSNAMTVPRFDGQAACAEIGGDDWFPEPGDTEWHRAKRICAGCEIRVECLAWALATREQYGVWAGTTPRQRRRIRALRLAGSAA